MGGVLRKKRGPSATSTPPFPSSQVPPSSPLARPSCPPSVAGVGSYLPLALWSWLTWVSCPWWLEGAGGLGWEETPYAPEDRLWPTT